MNGRKAESISLQANMEDERKATAHWLMTENTKLKPETRSFTEKKDEGKNRHGQKQIPINSQKRKKTAK